MSLYSQQSKPFTDEFKTLTTSINSMVSKFEKNVSKIQMKY